MSPFLFATSLMFLWPMKRALIKQCRDVFFASSICLVTSLLNYGLRHHCLQVLDVATIHTIGTLYTLHSLFLRNFLSFDAGIFVLFSYKCITSKGKTFSHEILHATTVQFVGIAALVHYINQRSLTQ